MNEKLQILVADDEQVIRLLLRRILEGEGFGVTAVVNGEEALAELKREVPALVMLDVTMPGMNGFQVCKRIREFSNVPIVLLSGIYNDEEKALATAAGATEFITKPFFPKELTARIKDILKANS